VIISRFNHLGRTATCEGQTDGETDRYMMTDYTTLEWHRAVQMKKVPKKPRHSPRPPMLSHMDLYVWSYSRRLVINFKYH